MKHSCATSTRQVYRMIQTTLRFYKNSPDEVIVFEGEMAGLKREKDDVKEVKKGFECGITLEGFTDIRENDVIEAYIMEEVKR